MCIAMAWVVVCECKAFDLRGFCDVSGHSPRAVSPPLADNGLVCTLVFVVFRVVDEQIGIVSEVDQLAITRRRSLPCRWR